MLIGADPPVAVAREDGHPLRRAPAPASDGQERRHRAPLRRARGRVSRRCGARGRADPRRLHGRRAGARSGCGLAADADGRAARSRGPKKWLRSATSIFSTRSALADDAAAAEGTGANASGAQKGKKLDAPMPLSEFAKRRARHDRNTVTPGTAVAISLTAGERTRILRMLRDEGGRIADEESQVHIGAAPPCRRATTSTSTTRARAAARAVVAATMFLRSRRSSSVSRRRATRSARRGGAAADRPLRSRRPLHRRRLHRDRRLRRRRVVAREAAADAAAGTAR